MSPVPALAWEADALAAALQPLLPGVRVEIVAATGSTNTDLCERLRGGEATPVLRVAEMQHAGRGRAGRSWHSAPGASLTFSLALPLSPRDWSGLSLAVGAALADAIEPQPARLQLKWPNDLWLRDATHAWRKLGGILIETTPVGGQRLAVLGIGLNVRTATQAVDPDLTHGRASVDEIDPAATPPAVLARVALPLVQALQRFEAQGFASFAAGFARRDLLAGRPLRTRGALQLEGTGAGVDAEGALLLRDAAGRLHAVGSGEVSVQPC